MSQEAKTIKPKSRFRFPIVAKTIVMIFVFALIIVEIAMTYYSVVMSNKNNETFTNIANSLSGTIAKVVDVDKVNTLKNKVDVKLEQAYADGNIFISDEYDESDQEAMERMDRYMAYYDDLWDDDEFVNCFENLRVMLRDIVEANKSHTLDCAYIAHVHPYIDEKGVQQAFFVYLCDSADEEDACPPGWLDPVYPVNREVITNPARGFPAYATDTNYGKLMTSGAPIYLGEDVIGFGFVDISLQKVRAAQADSIVRLFAYLSITVVLIAIAGIIVVYFIFSKPIKKLNFVAKAFNKENPEESHELFTNLKINLHDEIGDLADSMKVMEDAVRQRIAQLTSVNEALVNAQNRAAKMSSLANKDSLTGVQSKIAYDSKVEELDKLIKNKKELSFGVAMIDLNYLKHTNDEYGHDAGDESLIKLSNLICLVFAHSPVYRIGGDEFVVILMNNDYSRSEELINEFKERIEDSVKNKTIPLYKRVSAAIGYSEFDKEKDHCVDDVFKRADKNMYECKREMKKR